jgi:peptide/nickel transport system substrate-binding protein
LTALFLTALLLQLAPAAAQKLEPQMGGTLVVAQVGTPRSMNDIIDPGMPGIAILNITNEGLLAMTVEGEIVPVLATDLPEQPDDLTLIFTLRDDVVFHSGEPLTAEDVVYTLERLYGPDSIATFRAVWQENIANAEVLDDGRVKVTLKQPWPISLSFFAGNHSKIVNKSFVEAAGDKYGVSLWDGTGPFKIKEWVKDSHVTVVRNDNYWIKGKPYLDSIEFRVIPEPSTQLAAYQTGEVDLLLEPSFGQISVFERFPNTTIAQGPSAAESILTFRTQIAPMDDARVRRAISLAIDRQALIDGVLGGRGSLGGSIFPPYHWAHDPTIVVERDVEQARELLVEAGYDKNNPLRFTLVPLNEPLFVNQATLIQRQLAEAGIDMKIVQLEYTSASAMTAGPQAEWLGDAAMYRITPLRGTAFEFSWYQYDSKGPLNRSRYNVDGLDNARVEDLLNQASKLSDYNADQRAEAKVLYDEANRLILEDAPQLVLNFWDTVNVVSSAVHGFVPSPVNLPSFTEVWMEGR